MRKLISALSALAVFAGTSAANAHHKSDRYAPRAQAVYHAPVAAPVMFSGLPGAFVCNIDPWRTPFQCGAGM